MKLNFLKNEIASIHSAAFILGAAGLFSRVLGVLRDRLLAANFGAGRTLDIYYAAFQIPDFMSVVFLLGAGSAAILPVFQKCLNQDKDKAKRLISHLSTLFFAAAFAAAGLIFFLTPLLMNAVVPGFSENDRLLTSTLSRIMLLSPILLGLSGILSSVVQSYQRFLAFALAPVLYNLGIIFGILFFIERWGTLGLAAGVVLGAVLHFSVQLYAAGSLGFLPSISFYKEMFSAEVKQVLKLSFPRFVAVAVSNFTILALVELGSTLASGSIAVFRLAQNLFYFPIGIFGISYSIALFPKLSRSFLNNDGDEFYREIFLGIRTILFWIIPSAVLFIVLRAHLVRASLGAGAFSWEDTRLSSAILGVLAVAMCSEGISSLLIRAYYALENTWLPLLINVGSALFSVILAFAFTKILDGTSGLSIFFTNVLRIRDIPGPQVLGLALGFSLGSLANSFFLYRLLLRVSKQKFNKSYSFPVSSVLKILAAAVLAGLVAYIVRANFSKTLPLITFMQVLWQGAASGLVGMAVYFAVLLFLKNEEVTSVWLVIRKGLFKIRLLPKGWDGDAPL